MKISFAGLAVMMLASLHGCTQGTPGGPGITDTKVKKPAFGQTDDTFNLSVPAISALQQGEKTEATIGIKRAKNFDEDVTLTFADVPKGVTIEPDDLAIKHGDIDAKITLHASEAAVVGKFKVKIVGHPAKGGDAKVEFNLAVTPKDSFTLSAPRLSTSLKQGESKTFSIGIKRDKTFNQDVTLEFGDMPTGVSFEPSTPIIKDGESEAHITLTGADDASIGNFAIKLIGHPATGADASTEFKLVVIKP